MENASKALLIAGAVLIVIVLISVGMMIVNSSQDVTDQVGDITTNQAITTFNQQFNKYQGNQKGSAVKTLLQEIATNNSTNQLTSQHFVSVVVEDSINADASLDETNDSQLITKAAAEIVSSAKYKVVMEQTTDGYISLIKITR